MESKRIPIDVVVDDRHIAARCAGGEWNVGDLDNRWLWVLGAIALPQEHSIQIKDIRKQRQEHQKDMTFSDKNKDSDLHSERQPEENRVMHIADRFSMVDGSDVYSVSLAAGFMVDVKVNEETGLTYVMQNGDGATVYGEGDRETTYPDYP